MDGWSGSGWPSIKKEVPMGPLAMMLIPSLINTGMKLFNRPDKSRMTMSNADVDQMMAGPMSQLRSQFGGMNMANIAGIRQAGTANRLPSGAILSGIAGSSYGMGRGMAEGMSSLLPRFKGMQRQSEMDYYNADQDWKQSFSSDLGYMTQMAMLSKAGFFDQPENMIRGGSNITPRGYGGFMKG
jgi:hypothetical protein